VLSNPKGVSFRAKLLGLPELGQARIPVCRALHLQHSYAQKFAKREYCCEFRAGYNLLVFLSRRWDVVQHLRSRTPRMSALSSILRATYVTDTLLWGLAVVLMKQGERDIPSSDVLKSHRRCWEPVSVNWCILAENSWLRNIILKFSAGTIYQLDCNRHVRGAKNRSRNECTIKARHPVRSGRGGEEIWR
jgi:hypothetical protein